MKEEKLFDIVKNVDDDLICEMLEYSPDSAKDDVYEGVLYSVPENTGKMRFWRYPVTAAALLLVMVGVLVIFNSGNTLPYNKEEQTGDGQESTATTNDKEGEEITTDDPYTPVDTNIAYEFTEEDKELQKFLAETVNEAMNFQSLYDSGYFGTIGWQIGWEEEHDGIISARFPQLEEDLDKQISMHYVLLSDELPFKTASELEESLKQYYSAEVVSRFMGYVGIGEITQYTEEDCLIEIENVYFDDNGFLLSIPRFIEINGRLYRDEGAKGGWFTPNWSMAKVISKTDEELIFSYLGYGMDDIKEIRAGLGRLKYEDGWKYDWYDIIMPYEMVDFEEVWGTGNAETAEEPTPVVPDKVVNVGTFSVMYTNTYPEFSPLDTSEAEFTEMDTTELMAYYGLNNILEEMKNGSLIVIADDNSSHGFYTYPDGSVYDINTFTFVTPYDDSNCGKKFTITAGKASAFGREYSDEPNEWGTTPKYYNEEMETFFVIHELFGSYIMISGKVDELSDFDDEELKEAYHNSHSDDAEFWQGVPYELELFLQDALLCTLHYAQNEADITNQ